jgi:dCTP deaminase
VTILCDWEIRAHCDAGMVSPYDQALVNPASLDVRLGRHIRIECAGTADMALLDLERQGFTEADPYVMKPGQFILAETVETFHLPNTIAAQFMLKSSRAREGLEHLMAGYCDPGWHGSKLTMELHNSRQLAGVALWPGMKIGQMVFHRMSQAPIHDYSVTGRYNEDQQVTASKG